MKTVKLILLSLALGLFLNVNKIEAFAAGVHEKAIDQALEYLRTSNDAKDRWVYGFYEYHASRNGTSPNAVLSKMGPQPDNFLDTVIGGWWIGYRYFVEVQFLTNIGFTSYWHFTSTFRPGKYGDRFSGFAYPIAPDEGFFGLNNIVKMILYNQEVKSGSFENARGLVIGLKDIFQIVTKDWMGLMKDFYMGEKDSGWGLSGASDVIHDYQTQTSSTNHAYNGQYAGGTSTKMASSNSWRVPANNWDDIQDTYFSPGSNAATWWANQARHNSSFDDIREAQLKQIGYMQHWVVDAAAIVHGYSSTGNNHTGYEKYADDYIRNFKVNKEKVKEKIEAFKNSDMKTYAQKFSNPNELNESGCATPTGDIDQISSEGVAIKCLKKGNKTDPTLYAIGDILRWISIEASKHTKVLTDDSEETFRTATEDNITLAVAGVVLTLEKLSADLYKKKQYERITRAENAPLEGIWGYGVWTLNGDATFNQIR